MTTPTEQSILAFLNGEGPLDGKHFGERDERGRAFWWRKYLPTLARRIEAEGEAEPVAWRQFHKQTGAVVYAGPEELLRLGDVAESDGWTETPLYTHAPGQSARIAELEAALREAKRDTDGSLCVACQNVNHTVRQALKGSTDA